VLVAVEVEGATVFVPVGLAVLVGVSVKVELGVVLGVEVAVAGIVGTVGTVGTVATAVFTSVAALTSRKLTLTPIPIRLNRISKVLTRYLILAYIFEYSFFF
jgi:hypothetical protein